MCMYRYIRIYLFHIYIYSGKLQLDNVVFKAVAKVYAHNSDIKGIYNIINDMKTVQLPPSPTIYTMLFSVYI